jgi:hypothetical protein
MLRNTMDQSILFYIPKEFMRIRRNPEVLTVINRFKWRGNNRFTFITIQGIERLIYFTDEGEFHEEEFNMIPSFDENETEEEQFYSGLCNCYHPNDVN